MGFSTLALALSRLLMDPAVINVLPTDVKEREKIRKDLVNYSVISYLKLKTGSKEVQINSDVLNFNQDLVKRFNRAARLALLKDAQFMIYATNPNPSQEEMPFVESFKEFVKLNPVYKPKEYMQNVLHDLYNIENPDATFDLFNNALGLLVEKYSLRKELYKEEYYLNKK